MATGRNRAGKKTRTDSDKPGTTIAVYIPKPLIDSIERYLIQNRRPASVSALVTQALKEFFLSRGSGFMLPEGEQPTKPTA